MPKQFVAPSTWQLDRKERTGWAIVGDIDRAAVLRDDPAHDRQAQTAPPPLGRVIRQEQLFAVLRGNPGTVVAHRNPYHAIDRVVRRRELDRGSRTVGTQPGGCA